MASLMDLELQPELIARRAVALPIWRTQVECQVQETKEIGVLLEFVLKAIDAELQTSRDIADFLDLPEAVVVETMANLVNGSYIAVSRRDTSRESFVMTPSGRALLRDAVEIRPVRETVHFFQEALTGLLIEPTNDQLLSARQVEAQRLWVVPAVPSDPPAISQADNLRLAASYARSRPRGDKSFLELVDQIGPADKRFMSGEVRISRSEAGLEYEVFVDGRPNREVTIAFLEKDMPALLRIEKVLNEDQSELERWARDLGGLPSDDRKLRLIAERAARIDSGSQPPRRATSSNASEAPGNDSSESLAKLAERIEQSLRRVDLRYTSAAEHDFLLQKAFREAKESLVIVCPDPDPLYWANEVAPLITSVSNSGVEVNLYLVEGAGADVIVEAIRKSTSVKIGRVARGFPSSIVVDETWGALSRASWGARLGENTGRVTLGRGLVARGDFAARLGMLVADNTTAD